MPERTRIAGFVSHDRVSSMSYYIIRSPSFLLGNGSLSLSPLAARRQIVYSISM
jgi:hypothetical protein